MRKQMLVVFGLGASMALGACGGSPGELAPWWWCITQLVRDGQPIPDCVKYIGKDGGDPIRRDDAEGKALKLCLSENPGSEEKPGSPTTCEPIDTDSLKPGECGCQVEPCPPPPVGDTCSPPDPG